MLIVPDLEYLEKTDFHPFREITYLERPDDFSGFIMYYELDGSFANGWKYKDGEIIYSVSETPKKYDSSDKNVKIETRSGGCTDYGIYQYVEECTDHYQYVEFGDQSDLQYQYTTCVYYNELLSVYELCYSSGKVPGHPDSGGGYNPGGSVDDSSMGSVASIYSSQSTLVDDERQRLVGAFDALLNKIVL